MDVYKIECDGSCYYDIELSRAMIWFQYMDDDDIFTITKIKMKAVDYYNLPEFEGF